MNKFGKKTEYMIDREFVDEAFKIGHKLNADAHYFNILNYICHSIYYDRTESEFVVSYLATDTKSATKV